MELTRQSITMEAKVRSQVSPYGMCGGQNGTGTDFSPTTSGFPLSVLFHQFPAHIRSSVTDATQTEQLTVYC